MLTGAGLVFEYRAIARSRRKDSLFKTSCGCTAQVNKRAVHSKNRPAEGSLLTGAGLVFEYKAKALIPLPGIRASDFPPYTYFPL